MSLAISLISIVGLIKLLIVIIPPSINNFDTSEIRLIFSILSFEEKSRLLQIPVRTLSPSNTFVVKPNSASDFSS